MLKEKLTSLDELIWKQHEKITVKANKELGWNKYDLARLTVNIANLSFLTIGSLYGAHIYQTKNMGYLPLLFIPPILAYNNHNISKNLIDKMEKIELDIIKNTGASIPVIYDPRRPLKYITTFVMSSIGSGFLTYQDSNINIFGMTLNALAIFSLFSTSTNYFITQLMTPPSKKKNFWKILYEKVLDKTPEVKIPVENPIKY